jgi:hypothetical protein
MKNILLPIFICSSLFSFSQVKLNPIIRQSSHFNYIVHANGQDFNFLASIDSVSPGYMKLGWVIDGLGPGAWIMKKNSLEKATNGFWGEPTPGSDMELPDDQMVLAFSKLQWESIQKEKKVLFDQEKLVVKAPSEQQLMRLQGKTLDLIMLESENGGHRVWILNNASFPFIVKTEGSPKGIDLDLTSID